MMGRMPLAGVVWQVLHYLEGFRRLGFDVYYLEDTGTWPYDPERNAVTDDCRYSLKLISRTLAAYGFSERWAYRDATRRGEIFGLSACQLRDVLERADIIVNLTGSTRLRSEHLRVPLRVYLETDPVLPQIQIARGNAAFIELLAAHTHHFTYGENLGSTDCGVPVERFRYLATRQPIVLDWWTDDSNDRRAPASCFTTIANWRQTGKDIEWNGECYTWSKHHEFLKFIELPQCSSQCLELALAWTNPPPAEQTGADKGDEVVSLLKSRGWRIADALTLSKNASTYRDYILGSLGEFTVAKDQNVRLRSGWFSDRSACYLAAGRPVITQGTGFEKFIPTGQGLFAFDTMDDILSAMEAVQSNYTRHSRMAQAIAKQYFAAETVLGKLVRDLGV
jgi:hypothetical protein